MSNSLILQVSWKEQYENKWVINSPVEKTFMVNSSNKEGSQIHLLFELVVYVPDSSGYKNDPQ